jgi:hypothetical protein
MNGDKPEGPPLVEQKDDGGVGVGLIGLVAFIVVMLYAALT